MLGWLIGGVFAMALLGRSGTTRVRYRMTVIIDTPDGRRSGTAVRESTYRPSWFPFPFGESRGTVKLVGEAVAVDLPNGRTLFALLSSHMGDGDFAMRIPDQVLGHLRGQEPIALKQIWPTDNLFEVPKLVVLADPRDPRTVRPLAPGDLGGEFGSGYELASIVVERTTDPVTSGIAERMPYFGQGSGYREWYWSLPPADRRQIGPEDFRREKT